MIKYENIMRAHRKKLYGRREKGIISAGVINIKGDKKRGGKAKKSAGNNQWVSTGQKIKPGKDRRDGPGGENG